MKTKITENEALMIYAKAYANFMNATEENGVEADVLFAAEQQLELSRGIK